MSGKPNVVKCLVWDLDNTLWSGTLLEDGEVSMDDAVRDVIVELDSRGILHSVSSKNDHDRAWARLEELGVAQYFVLPHIGWGRKSDAVLDIAEQLKFAQNTIAFMDDQPAERAEVAFHAPEVRCYDATQALSLPDLPEFSPASVTVDSRRRREMYQAGFRRSAEQEKFNGPDEEFLRSLQLELRIGRAGGEELSRVEELTLRTSQMNATGVHYSDETLRGLLADPDHEVLVATLTDRFGTHGAIGVMLLDTSGEAAWNLKLLATSCRVVSFGVGTAILNWLADQAARAGVHLLADFRRTDRNRMMEVAYRFAGFGDGEDCACLAGTDGEGGGDGGDDIQRLHLVPARHEAPSTLTLIAPHLAGGVPSAV
ncbi:HAD-IIIC family phosphatase [Streptomyces sp. NPDC090052]|uniref:HAD-IIIC family phosphatase n=1 Tax=Streptomyces sp. NPDC090052 TaxID=3365931 RepID=UPI0037F76B93